MNVTLLYTTFSILIMTNPLNFVFWYHDKHPNSKRIRRKKAASTFIILLNLVNPVEISTFVDHYKGLIRQRPVKTFALAFNLY